MRAPLTQATAAQVTFALCSVLRRSVTVEIPMDRSSLQARTKALCRYRVKGPRGGTIATSPSRPNVLVRVYKARDAITVGLRSMGGISGVDA
jgi:hypothetical protein